MSTQEPNTVLSQRQETQEPLLRAMARNYKDGHSWDHLDGEACVAAADEIRALREQLSVLQVIDTPAGDIAGELYGERDRQLEVEGWTTQHDDRHRNGEIARAAAAYAHSAGRNNDDRSLGGAPIYWPWSLDDWKTSDRRRELVKAGALIIAEIERLDRLERIKLPDPESLDPEL